MSPEDLNILVASVVAFVNGALLAELLFILAANRKDQSSASSSSASVS